MGPPSPRTRRLPAAGGCRRLATQLALEDLALRVDPQLGDDVHGLRTLVGCVVRLVNAMLAAGIGSVECRPDVAAESVRKVDEAHAGMVRTNPA